MCEWFRGKYLSDGDLAQTGLKYTCHGAGIHLAMEVKPLIPSHSMAPHITAAAQHHNT